MDVEGDGIASSNTEDDHQVFNPHVLFTTGAANAGINNLDSYGVLRAEMPPPLEDCV